MKATLTLILEYEEGYRENPYYCSEGYPTIGIGKKLGPKGAPLEHYQFKCSPEIAELWLAEEVNEIKEKLFKYEWFQSLDETRKMIIISMAYQMGTSGVLKFKKMIVALQDKDYEEAAKQALDSRWARQTPARAARHSEVLRHGDAEMIYWDLVR